MTRPSTEARPGVASSVAPLDTEAAWVAVVARDQGCADDFVYAVATTGIYCRPGCASRAPRRENTRFFTSAEEAEAAGFRPCKRCRPDGDHPSAAKQGVARARAYLDANLDERVTLERLARVAHMSAYHLQRTFKRHTGLTPREYAQAGRMARLKERLREGDTVSRATFEAGYGSPSRVYEQAGAHLGMTPAAYRDGGDGVRIRFSTARAPVGWVLVATTERGVCAVALGDDPAALETDLRDEYPRAEIAPAQDGARGLVAELVAYLHGSGPLPDAPLDLRASAFRWRVWKALQAIPHGATRSYREVAEAIGVPSGARAVAQACAGNPVALLIPCHRVVRRDGQPGGYRWGAERKARLLEMETDQDSSGEGAG